MYVPALTELLADACMPKQSCLALLDDGPGTAGDRIALVGPRTAQEQNV